MRHQNVERGAPWSAESPWSGEVGEACVSCGPCADLQSREPAGKAPVGGRAGLLRPWPAGPGTGRPPFPAAGLPPGRPHVRAEGDRRRITSPNSACVTAVSASRAASRASAIRSTSTSTSTSTSSATPATATPTPPMTVTPGSSRRPLRGWAIGRRIAVGWAWKADRCRAHGPCLGSPSTARFHSIASEH
jgi:hypothetical protein